MIKVSKIYFDFEKIIIIDFKSNIEESNQHIFVNIPYLFFIWQVKALKRHPCELHSNKTYLEAYLNQKLYKFINCLEENNISSKDFLSNEFIENYSFSKYPVIISGKEYNFSDIPNKSNYYYYSNDSFQVYGTYLYYLATIEISENIYNKNDYSFLKVFNSEFISLNSYNSFKKLKANSIVSSRDYRNLKFFVKKTMHQYLEAPYGDCSDYQDRLFNSTNKWQCYRQCIKTFAEKKFYCKPVFIENTLHELDSDYYLDCNSSVQKKFDEYFQTKNISSKCAKICPKNCLNIDFRMESKSETKDFKTSSNDIYYKTLVWDTTQPMFVYKEVPVLSFIEYMVYLGGLVGLWFGTSAEDVVIILFDTTFWFNLWNNFLIKYLSHRNPRFIRINH